MTAKSVAGRVRKSGSSLGRVAVGTIIFAASAFTGAIGNAEAADRNTYPPDHATTPWSFQDVQDFLDPAACSSNGGGRYGTPCPVAGDNIIFNGHADGTSGVYIPPAGPPKRSYRLRTDNVDLTGNNAIIAGSSANSQALLRTFSQGNTISGFTFEARGGSSKLGVFAEDGFTPENPVIVTGNEFYGFEQAGSWVNSVTTGANATPGFIFESNFLKNLNWGILFSPAGQMADATRIWARFANNTIEGLRVLGYQPLFFPGPSGAIGDLIVPGLDEFVGNVFVNSDGVPLPGTLTAPSLASRSGSVAGPSRNGEHLVGLNPAPGIPYVGTLEELFPDGDNFTGAMLTNPHRRPIIGVSNSVVSRQAGAFTPAGDANGDWAITSEDIYSFVETFLNPPPIVAGGLIPKMITIHDADGDMDVDFDDFGILMSGFSGEQPNCDGLGLGDFDAVTTVEELAALSPQNTPALPTTAIASTRFLSIQPNNEVLPTAMRITPTAMPLGYENLIGQSMYLGPLEEIGESGSSKEPVEGLGTFFASSLQCFPVYADWGSTDIKVTGAMIIPGGEFVIQNLGDGCVATIEANFSQPLGVATSIQRGDILSQAGPPGDGTNIDDVLGVLKGFSSAPGAPSKYRTDMEPAVIDFKINISDALDALGGFAGLAYSRPGPEPCP